MNLLNRKYNFRLKTEHNKRFILDIVRKKMVVLTPEEWVRQHVIHHLIYDCGYAKGRMACEKSIQLGQKTFRFDLAVMNAMAEPRMLIEIKRPEVSLSKDVFEQLLHYNMVCKAPYLAWSNGLHQAIYHSPSSEWHTTYPEVTSVK